MTATGGAQGNGRLAALIGVALIGVLAAQAYTLLDVRGRMTLHITLGIVVVALVLTKVTVTSYRLAGYYLGRGAYVRRGRPHPALRVLGPAVALSSLASTSCRAS